MPKYIEKIENLTLPVIGLRGIVAFPSVPLSFELSEEVAIHAAEAAFETDSFVLICAVSDLDAAEITPDALFRVGPVAKIKQSVKTPDGGMRIITEGFSRATVTEFRSFADYLCADAISKVLTMTDEEREEGVRTAVRAAFEEEGIVIPEDVAVDMSEEMLDELGADGEITNEEVQEYLVNRLESDDDTIRQIVESNDLTSFISQYTGS